MRYIGDIAYLVTFEQVEPTVCNRSLRPGQSGAARPAQSARLFGIPAPHRGKHPARVRLLKPPVTRGRRRDHTGAQALAVRRERSDNPRETEVYRLGDQGSYSPALYDHRAFLHYSSKDIIGIPVTLYEQFGNNSGDRWSRNYKFAFDGLYLFRVTEESIKFVGHLSQSDGITDEGEIYRQNLNIRRGVYIGDRIYLFSDARASMYSLDTLELLEETDL